MSRYTILINLMLLDSLSQSLSLPLIPQGRIHLFLVHLIDRRGFKIAHFYLSILVPYHNVLRLIIGTIRVQAERFC